MREGVGFIQIDLLEIHISQKSLNNLQNTSRPSVNSEDRKYLFVDSTLLSTLVSDLKCCDCGQKGSLIEANR